MHDLADKSEIEFAGAVPYEIGVIVGDADFDTNQAFTTVEQMYTEGLGSPLVLVSVDSSPFRNVAVITNPHTFMRDPQLSFIRLDATSPDNFDAEEKEIYVDSQMRLLDMVREVAFPNGVGQTTSNLIGMRGLHSIKAKNTARRVQADVIREKLRRGAPMASLGTQLTKYFDALSAQWVLQEGLKGKNPEFAARDIGSILGDITALYGLDSCPVITQSNILDTYLNKEVTHHVLEELIANNQKYRNKDGEAHYTKVDINKVGIDGIDYLNISVAGNCIPIAPNSSISDDPTGEIHAIFREDYRTSSAQKIEEGNGKGLFILASYVLDSGGKIKLKVKHPDYYGNLAGYSIEVYKDENGVAMMSPIQSVPLESFSPDLNTEFSVYIPFENAIIV